MSNIDCVARRLHKVDKSRLYYCVGRKKKKKKQGREKIIFGKSYKKKKKISLFLYFSLLIGR